MSNIKIFVITHKAIQGFTLPNDYQFMLVGAENKKEFPDGYILDNCSKDNISSKNTNYCELTGQYWIWKNASEKVVGLVHYRRFFTSNQLSTNKRYFISRDRIDKIVQNGSIIVAQRNYTHTKNNREDYSKYHYEADWEVLKEIVVSEYPTYEKAFLEMEKSNWFYPFNMLIAPKTVFNEYSKWLFGVLRKVEDKCDISSYDTHQARIYGYMSERLLAVWVNVNKVSVTELPVVQLDSRFKYRLRRSIERVLKHKFKFEG